MTLSIRKATLADEAAILALIKHERLNPMDLHWQRFTVAEHDGAVIGAVQVRAHRDGGRELGSLVVATAHRGQGLARRLIDAALAEVPGEVWMITGRAHVGHYARWNFHPAPARTAPRGVLFNYLMGRAGRVISWWLRMPPTHLTLLRRVG